MPVLTMAKPLERYREEHYMSVTDFSRFLGISVNTYYSIVRNKPLNYATMRKVAAKLGVHPSDIKEFVVQSEDEESD